MICGTGTAALGTARPRGKPRGLNRSPEQKGLTSEPPELKKHPVKLKLIITNESDLPTEEAIRNLYQKTGDKWVLEVEGAVPKHQLDEFRNNNVELKKKLDAFGDITPERLAELIEKENTFKAGNAKTAEQIQAEVERRVAELKAAQQREIDTREQKITKLTRDLESHVIDQALLSAGAELGLRTTAHEDLTYRGRQQFKLDEHGKPVAIDKDGQVIYGPAGEPLTPRDFVSQLTKQAPHLFDPSQGSGAGGSGSKSGHGNANNPWKQETFNLTAQSQMLRDTPDLARQMAAAAGVKI